ncbi:MAG: hypothetical protein KBC95_04925 [Candidatus Peribacteraceae bacterium]|nr:hypothetical protein [Candidatus Peribacteraceae bacterium]
MRIGVIGSLQFVEQLFAARDGLRAAGHDAFISSQAEPFLGKTQAERDALNVSQKMEEDAIREFWRLMQGADAVLAVNLEKRGIPGYVGGNTLLELGFAHVLGQKIFLWEPIPDIPYYRTEIEAMRPVVIHGDLSLVR